MNINKTTLITIIIAALITGAAILTAYQSISYVQTIAQQTANNTKGLEEIATFINNSIKASQPATSTKR